MENLIKAAELDDPKSFIGFFNDIKIMIDQNRKNLGYREYTVIRENIDLSEIIKIGTWIARPLDFIWIDLFAFDAVEHHGLVTGIDTVTHFYGDVGKKDATVRNHTLEHFITTQFNYVFNVYYPENILEEFENINVQNNLEETLKIASDKLGSSGYNFLLNNCERFVADCIFKKKVGSLQAGRFFQFMNQILLEKSFANETDHVKVYKRIYECTSIPFRKFQYDPIKKNLKELSGPSK